MTVNCSLEDVRRADLPDLPPERPRPFRTKLQMAAEQLDRAESWLAGRFSQLWVVADGGYAKRPSLKAVYYQTSGGPP